MKYDLLSERRAHAFTASQVGDKPACEAIGGVVQAGVFRPGLLFVNEPVRARTLTFELFEPADDHKPGNTGVKLGEVTVKLGQHLKKCEVGMCYTDLELEVIHAEHT